MWPLFVLWDVGMGNVLVEVTGVLLAFTISLSLVRLLCRDNSCIKDPRKRHNWQSAASLNRPCYCSVCEILLVQGEGHVCDSCGICSHSNCATSAVQNLACKSIHSSENAKHLWVKGNLTSGAICEVCEEEAGVGCGLVDQFCCWCHRNIHTKCLLSLGDVCDFGRFKTFIIPPNCIKVESRRGHLQLKTIEHPGWMEWTPLIVMANCRSGSNDGSQVLAMFRSVLNPAQCIDLEDRTPEVALEWCKVLHRAGAKPIVLVAGGDGTIGWVLNAIHNLKIEPAPPVAVIPLGTGNDLSRVLGWGKEFSPNLQPEEVLKKLLRASVTRLDRWELDFRWKQRVAERCRQQMMYNYISVGVDAQVTLDFHRTRESAFYIISSRIFNKMLYLLFGTQQVVERECRNLEERVEVYLDGKLVELPEIESIVILNIPSWGAGCRLWELLDEDDAGEQSINDGKLEVLALYSSFHMAQLQVGLSSPHLVGQAQSVVLKLKDKVPIQIDGEPSLQRPCTININRNGQVVMLSNIPAC